MSDLEVVVSNNFPPKLRLLTAKQFKQVFTNPVKVTSSNFTLLATPNSTGHPRLGLIVAKKNVRFAVDRNRVKRLCRESFRCNQNLFPSFDIVLLSRRGSSELTNRVLFAQLDQLWSKLVKRLTKKALKND